MKPHFRQRLEFTLPTFCDALQLGMLQHAKIIKLKNAKNINYILFFNALQVEILLAFNDWALIQKAETETTLN